MSCNGPRKDYIAIINPRPPPTYIPPASCLPPCKALLTTLQCFRKTYHTSPSPSLKSLDLAFDRHFPFLIDVYNGLPDFPPKRGIFTSDADNGRELEGFRAVREELGNILTVQGGILMRSGYRQGYPTSELGMLRELEWRLGRLIALLEK